MQYIAPEAGVRGVTPTAIMICLLWDAPVRSHGLPSASTAEAGKALTSCSSSVDHDQGMVDQPLEVNVID
jgi:hypothetical protein